VLELAQTGQGGLDRVGLLLLAPDGDDELVGAAKGIAEHGL